MKKGIKEQEFLIKTIVRFSEIRNALTTKVSKVYTKFTMDKIKDFSLCGLCACPACRLPAGGRPQAGLCTLWLKRTSDQFML
jgi:hypothetical protein